MRSRIHLFLCAVFVMLGVVPTGAAADDGDSESSGPGIMMPDLQQVLGNAYEVPRELSDRAVPGAILKVTPQGYDPVMQGCVSGEPGHNNMTNVAMQSSLSGGVHIQLGGTGGAVSGATRTQLGFIDPEIVGFDLISFAPSTECVEQLTAFSERHSLADLILVREALMARLKGCGSKEASVSGRTALFGGASASATSMCELFSSRPVVVGVRAVRVLDLPEFAELRETTSASSAAAAPAGQARGHQVEADVWRTCAVSENGEYLCWGQEPWHKERPEQKLVSFNGHCGITTDGEATCWADKTNWKTTEPEGIFATVHNPGGYACGLRPNGAVECWGDVQDSNADVPPDDAFQMISMDSSYGCGVTTAGQIKCWGDADSMGAYGQMSPPDGTFTSVSCSYRHACAVDTGGVVTCWGQEDNGRLEVPDGRYTSVSTGSEHSCAVTVSGAVRCWGFGRRKGGKLARSIVGGNAYGMATDPPGFFRSVSAGMEHNCGVTTQGTVSCWGRDHLGQATPPAGLVIATD